MVFRVLPSNKVHEVLVRNTVLANDLPKFFCLLFQSLLGRKFIPISLLLGF